MSNMVVWNKFIGLRVRLPGWQVFVCSSGGSLQPSISFLSLKEVIYMLVRYVVIMPLFLILNIELECRNYVVRFIFYVSG